MFQCSRSFGASSIKMVVDYNLFVQDSHHFLFDLLTVCLCAYNCTVCNVFVVHTVRVQVINKAMCCQFVVLFIQIFWNLIELNAADTHKCGCLLYFYGFFQTRAKKRR